MSEFQQIPKQELEVVDNTEIEEENDSKSTKNNTFSRQLKRVHDYEAERQLEKKGIDYQKIDQFILQITGESTNDSEKHSNSVDDLSIEEIKYLLDLNMVLDSPDLRSAYTKEDISKILTKLIKAKEDPKYYVFFDYDKNEGYEKQNLKTSEAISDTICFQNLTPEEIQKLTETVIKGFFQGPALNDSNAVFSFVSHLLSYPPVKQYAEPIIMNYWFMWSDRLKQRCEKMDFENIEPQKVKQISQILVIAQNSFTFLESQGLEPNGDDAFFMLKFIKKCQDADNYYLNIKAEAATQQIIGSNFERFSLKNMAMDRQRMRNNLRNNAFQILDPKFSRKDRFGLLNEKIIQLQEAPFSHDGQFQEMPIASDVDGLYDQKMNLIFAVKENENIDFANLSSLNQYGQIPTSDFYDLMDLQNPVLKEIIRLDFGVDLSTLTLRVQNQFLNFIKNGNKKLIAGVREFVLDVDSDDQKISRIKSFLSLEEDSGMASKIFSIEKKYIEKSEPIFSKYAEIVDAVENVRAYLLENYHGQTDSQAIELIIQNLLRKGKDLLSDFADKTLEPDEVIKALDDYQTDNMFFISVLKAKKERGEPVYLAEFSRFQPEIHSETSPILPEDQTKILDIVRKNWSAHPAFTETVVKGVSGVMNNLQRREFIIFKYGDQIDGCMRFDQTDDPAVLHWASVNVAPSLRGSGLGKALLRDYFLEKVAGKIIEAETLPSDEIASSYINDFGFIADRVTQFGDTGEFVFEITRDDIGQPEYQFQGQSYQELQNKLSNLDQSSPDGPVILSFDLKTQYNQMISTVEDYLNNQGFILTSFPRLKDGHCLIALEKRISVIPAEEPEVLTV